ncbi:MAG TPA: efflux RND transporter permease subunit [Chthoniobacterales bacterium]|jgi:CzcA family heavy metal efflux pump|nr:efflux RND transporter permease subunit [Chthoniobacterales bacterium]
MWIVKLALRRPYTFVVMALLILLLGITSIKTTPTDIFPEIDIPVVTVVWQYTGLSPDQMAKQITTFSEYTISSAVDNVKNIESQTMSGTSVIRIFFQPNVRIDAAIAQVTAVSQTILRRMPPGTQPPFIIRYNASSVPILQLALGSKTLSEAQLYDYGLYRVRQAIAPVRGATLPLPFGGKPRQIMVDLDPQALLSKGLSPLDVSNAINAQNLTLPTGTAKIAEREFIIGLNGSPDTVAELNNVPIKQVNGSMVYIRDVAHVRDGFSVQTNVVRKDGNPSALLTILKNGGASTLDIVNQIKALLPGMRAAAPPGLEMTELFDQSIFVRAAISGVVKEGVIAALLTATMILLFLGNWRSTFIVMVSIPLSILASLSILSLLGYTLNVMTLGGLALAIGILVDDATVEIENIHRNLAQGKPVQRAILDGAQQIAVPAFVSTLAICIVFVSVVFLTGPAKYLFTPLALAVVFAMLASYLLSRTLVPVMVKYMIRGHESEAPAPNFFTRIQKAFEGRFENLRRRYVDALAWSLQNRGTVFILFAVLVGSAFAILPIVGRDFFPTVDAGQFRLHVNAPPGTRLEETEQIFSRVEDTIREVVPPNDLALVLDDIGTPYGVNLAFTDNSTISSADGEILVSLKPDHHGSTPAYLKTLRETLAKRFPDLSFYFQPADIVSQILNFGLPAPIDIQVAGYAEKPNYAIAREIEARVKQIPGAVDVGLHQVTNAPEMLVRVDRTRAQELGFTERDIANSLLISLSGTAQVTPNFWADPKTGINYPVAIQTPQHLVNSVDSMLSTSLAGNDAAHPQLLTNVVSLERAETPAVESHTNVQPVFDIYANVQGADLGRVSDKVTKIVNELRPKLPPGSTINVRGQVESMNTAFSKLGLGLIFAAVLIYFLMVVNFQSWTDPFIIITALPGAFAGILWMLFLTHTTFNVESMMGAIMSIGVATSNSILMITFANEQLREGRTALDAAIAAGHTRLRPVLMTAMAMIIGMVPMALGLGEGGEQNAPLGRAVIGGLFLATIATLFLVPFVFSVIRHKLRPRQIEDDPDLVSSQLEPAPQL